MKRSALTLSIAAALSLPGLAGAQQAAPAAEAKSPHTFTGNLTIISDYRFRGISQTFGKP
ncbi:MAG TPA: TorF family putative porin, partial [Burkholderiales bacterium]|nr:TorF family putative porin [Burkholderiales bacterium]